MINVDHGYVGTPSRVDLIAATGALIKHANACGVPVIVVTNQSGVGRGYFDWTDFEATMDVIHNGLAQKGACIDAVLACAYHQDGNAPYDIADHPMRKPQPGMINTACEAFSLDRTRSLIAGDSWTDMQAGQRAGLCGGIYVGEPRYTKLPEFPVTPYRLEQDEDSTRLLEDYDDFLQGRGSPWSRAF